MKSPITITREELIRIESALKGAIVLAKCLASAKARDEERYRGGYLPDWESEKIKAAFLENNDNALAIQDCLQLIKSKRHDAS